MNFILNNKTELKIFFTIWLCLSFALAPIAFGLLLTPKFITPQVNAQIPVTDAANLGAKIGDWVWKTIQAGYNTIKDWAIAQWDKLQDQWWEWTKAALLMAVQVLVHQLLARLTNSIIKWIQSDFHGKPGFITNWQDEMKGAANAAAGRFLNELAGINLCQTFKFKIRAALALPIPTFKTEAACTLDGILASANATIEQFQKDFRSGGWLAFEASLQPNNNAFGAYLMAQDKKQALEFAEIQKKDKETRTGFKPTKKCLSTNTENSSQNLSACNEYKRIIDAGQPPATGAIAQTQEDYNSVVSAYQSQCTGTAADPSAIDPDSADCASSIVTMPDGTVELNTNLTATSGIRSIEQTLSGITTSLGPYGPYVTAIANALINQLVKDGVSGLLDATTQPETYQEPTMTTPETENLFAEANASSDISNDINIITRLRPNIETVLSGNGPINNTIKYYQDLLNIVQPIQNTQNDIINNEWARGVWTGATETIISGPTTTSTGTSTITTTQYKISQNKVGEAIITKTTTTDSFGATTVTYAIDSYKNQIEDIDGVVSLYQSKINDYQNILSSASSALSAVDNFKLAGDAYLVLYQQSPSSPSTQAALNDAKQARDLAINELQKMLGSSSTTLEALNQELETILTNTQISLTLATADNKQTYYQTYYNEVLAIYNSLVLAGVTP